MDWTHDPYFFLLQLCRDGAWVENKGPLLTFHYRETPINLREPMIEKAKKIIDSFGFKAYEAHCAIEAKPPVQWNKGRSQTSEKFEILL